MSLLKSRSGEFELISRNVLWVGLARSAKYVRGLIFLPILTKMLGADYYGAWSIMLVTVYLLLPIVMLGLPYGLGRFIPGEKDKHEVAEGLFSTIYFVALFSSIGAISIYFLSDVIADGLLKNIAYSNIIKLISPLIVLQSLNQICTDFFVLRHKAKKYSMLMIAQTCIEISLVYLFISSGYSLFGAALGLLISRGAILGVSMYFIVSHIGLCFPSVSVFSSYFRYGIHIVPSAISEWIISSSDKYMIGLFLGAASVGLYSASYGIATIPLVAMYIVTFASSPIIFKSYDEGRIQDTQNYLSYSLKYILILIIPSVFGLSILARPILLSLTTAEFARFGIFIIPLVSSSIIFEAVRATYGRVLQLYKRTKLFAIASLTAGLVNIGLNIFFIPHFGIIGAATTTLIAYSITGIIMYRNSQKYIKFSIDKKSILKSISASIIMSLAIFKLNPGSMVGLISSVSIGIVTYICTMLLMRSFQKNELKIIFKVLKLRKIYERL